MAVYGKEYLVGAFLARFYDTADDVGFAKLEDMANSFYDEVGKDKFRDYCGLSPAYLRRYDKDIFGVALIME